MALTNDDKQFIAETILQTEDKILKRVVSSEKRVIKYVDGVEKRLTQRIDLLEEQVEAVVSSDYIKLQDHEKRIGKLEKTVTVAAS